MKATEEQMLKRHPIQVVSRRSGLTQDVLRKWEQRYDVVEPGRSEGGQRLYSDLDIERLRLLRIAVAGGRRISEVSKLKDQELVALAREDVSASPTLTASAIDADTVLACLEAVRNLDAELLEEILHRQLLTHGHQGFIEGLVAPVMVEVGRLWHEGELGSSDEHMATEVLRGFLARVLADTRPGTARGTIVVATTKEQRHAVGGLLASATAAQEQWRVVYLGPDLPAQEIVAACKKAQANTLALSFTYENKTVDDLGEIREVAAALPSHITLVVGGVAAVNQKEAIHALGAIVVENLAEFRAVLASVGN